MSILEKLRGKTSHLAPAGVSLANWQKMPETSFASMSSRSRPAPELTDELKRVLALMRRAPVDLGGVLGPRGGFDATAVPGATAQALVHLMNERLRREPRACACASMGRPCIMSLMPAQAWALYEAPLAGGLLGPIGVGHGKTGIDILAAMVMPNCKKAVLLIPPGLRQQLVNDYLAWREHFRVPSLIIENKAMIVNGAPTLHVVPYSRFSRHESTDLLRQLAPDLIIADEGHKLRHRNTATTGRVLRYFAEHEECRLCVWSGTLTARSIKDYAHLAAIALREDSPLPLDPAVVEEWSVSLDPSDWPAPAGELRRFCKANETLHEGFHRRLVETRGVVATRAGAIDASINIIERKAPPIPKKLDVMLDRTRATQTRPDGEEFIDALQTAACARQLACGFYYRWKFPKGEPEELILRWFNRRKEWSKELREKLKARREHLDSPLLASKAAIRAYQDPPYEGDLPVWYAECWLPWIEVRDLVYHETEAVWEDDFLARDAAEWATKHRGIVWYEHEAFGARVAALSGLPLHGGGPGAEQRILAEKGDRSIVASIKAHGTGRDGLQRIFHEQLVANPPASGDTWEQLLGRLHRIGQDADEVDTYVYRHTEEMADAIDRAVIQAKYIQGTMGTLQKLLCSDVSFDIGGTLKKVAF